MAKQLGKPNSWPAPFSTLSSRSTFCTDNPFLDSNMAAQNPLSFPSQHSLSDHNHRPYLQPVPPDQYNNPEELKASYDDLIDQYSTPYDTHPHQHAFPMDQTSQPTPNHHHHGPSLPLSSSKSPFSAKQSDDTHETSQVLYPPQPVPSQLPETPGFWQKVRDRACFFFFFFSTPKLPLVTLCLGPA